MSTIYYLMMAWHQKEGKRLYCVVAATHKVQAINFAIVHYRKTFRLTQNITIHCNEIGNFPTEESALGALSRLDKALDKVPKAARDAAAAVDPT